MNRIIALVAATTAAFGVAPLSSVEASTLTFDGKTSVHKLMNDNVQLSVKGGPNLPVTLLIDISPGPTFLFNQNLPLGFTPLVLLASAGTTSAAGEVNVTVPLPLDPLLHDVDAYVLAVVHDPSFPFGFDFSNGAHLRLLDRNVDLAGRSLAQYPFFEHTRAFNVGDPVEFGIDPTIYPFVVGQTADVYVVLSQSKADWITNPTLTDVAGGPIPFTFAAGGIQANTVTLNPGTLNSATGGAGMGVPYDVVVDLDQNGVLNGDDLIDGYAAEAGFYMVHDLTAPGPYAVTEGLYSGGTFLGQDVYYPSNIAALGKLPLVVVSHGNGHNYQWYDHIGFHLASYGYVVMSHQNNTQPGSHTAALTTLSNTEYILANQATIEGGALNGHIDGDNIVWIGHSRGGDGVVRAYDDIVDGDYAPVNFQLSDIKLISSIAPVDFGGFDSSNPHGANYHLWVGQADADVHGCASADQAQWYHLHDRALNVRQSISLYGTGHGDFHDGGGSSVATGPCLIGRAATHLIMKGYLLPLVEHHIRGNVPAKDYLWRQYEVFHPRGAPVANPCVTVNLQYRDQDSSGKFVIEDYQTNPLLDTSSSGGGVSWTLLDYREGNMDDGNTQFAHVATDQFNGFTNDGAGDESKGGVFTFDGAADYRLTFDVVAGQRDLREYAYLSFRSAQGSRHPFTIAQLADSVFTVTLRDSSGGIGSINVGAYGGGIEEPYQRNTGPSCGVGVGWNSEFETIRIRLRDFERDGVMIDLSDVVQVNFEFGPSHGTPQGRMGIDDIELNAD